MTALCMLRLALICTCDNGQNGKVKVFEESDPYYVKILKVGCFLEEKTAHVLVVMMAIFVKKFAAGMTINI